MKDKHTALLELANQPHLVRLCGRVQHYSWGGFDFIPRLIKEDNPNRQPYAELWMGAHPRFPSIADIGIPVPLDELIAADPRKMLGNEAAALFQGKLPYLFKVLDVRQMLSIQVHPSLDQAQKGFARENRKGIPLQAPERNYKDPYHKPELHIALTDFWMLHGFRPYAEIVRTLKAVAAFQPLADYETKLSKLVLSEADKLRRLYSYIMEMPQVEVDAMLSRLYDQLAQTSKSTMEKRHPHYWAWRAFAQFPPAAGHWDRGVFSIYLMNLVHIPEGRGTFQPARVPHAYLEGVTVELMANSDNVLRGGLTDKHIDVKELLQTVSYEGAAPKLVKGRQQSSIERIYRVPSDGFQLSRLTLPPGKEYKSRMHHGPDILLLLEGEAWVNSLCLSLLLDRGDIIFVPANVPYVLRTTASAVLFKATTAKE
ncbi:mannose-6-phosphate isomerase, class I [bacterium]|nr:mannose-6-phosphate isomerase, class I [bacterium]